MLNRSLIFLSVIFLVLFFSPDAVAQYEQREVSWTREGHEYYKLKEGNIVKADPATGDEQVIIKKSQFIPAGSSKPLQVAVYHFFIRQ